jgi:hypothetical protein
LVRAGSQLERKLRHEPPRLPAGAELSGERQDGEDRH